jgi:hypothetical protein
MKEVLDGFYWGYGFFGGICAGLGSLALIFLFFVTVIGGLADRWR